MKVCRICMAAFRRRSEYLADIWRERFLTHRSRSYPTAAGGWNDCTTSTRRVSLTNACATPPTPLYRMRLSQRYFSTTSYATPEDEHTLLVIQPEYKTGRVEIPYVPAERKLEEAVSLVEAINGWSVHTQRVDAVRGEPQSKTFFGRGKISELKKFAGNLPVSGIYLNVPRLTSIQHQTLEALFDKQVFDRYGIVLRIFKERARTKEAKIQVELAEIPYLRGKLVDLEAQNASGNGGGGGGRTGGRGGGGGGTGGGGGGLVLTTKQSMFRKKREGVLKQELKRIRDHRKIMSEQRKRHHLPVVAVVGYTNSGKTTLIQHLCKDENMSPEDMLFATLDTTVHAGRLPCGQKCLFVDTVGFISDLPHELVESFSSTLDDVTHADVVLNVRDVSHPQAYSQRADVLKVLRQLNLSSGLVESMIDVGNKIDKIEGEVRLGDSLIPISALHGTGTEELLMAIEREVISRTGRKTWKILLPLNGPELSWLYGEPEVTVCEVSPIATKWPHPQDHLTPPTSELELSEVVAVRDDVLAVKAILTEGAGSRFRARFSRSVRIIENV